MIPSVSFQTDLKIINWDNEKISSHNSIPMISYETKTKFRI